MSAMSFFVSDIHVYIIITYMYIHMWWGVGWKKHWYIYICIHVYVDFSKNWGRKTMLFTSLCIYLRSSFLKSTHMCYRITTNKGMASTHTTNLVGPLLSQSDQQCKALTVGSLCHLERCESKRGRNTLRHTAKWGFDMIWPCSQGIRDLSPTQTGVFNQ